MFKTNVRVQSNVMTHQSNMPGQNAITLRQMMEQSEEQISLAEAALLIAASEYPELDAAEYIERLDTMAGNIRQQIKGEADALQTIAGINRYLFEEEGFCGNADDYYDPRNSFLNEVLDRKTGIPITLSTVYLEIAERLKLPLVGVGLPGHFLVKHPSFDILIDPFSKGRILSEDDCREQMTQLLGESVPFQKSYLEAVSKRHIIGRMLNNLRTIYVNAKQFQKALSITGMAVAVHPDSALEWKQRAAILIHMRRHGEAIADLNRYLELAPEAEDAKEIRQVATDLRKSLAQFN